MTEEPGKMSFLQHLEELRSRLIKCIVSILVGIIICWFFRERIREFLEAPLYEAWASVEGLPEPQPLSFTSLLEPFIAYLKMSAIGGLFVASPVILYQLWKFIAPGLYAREKKFVLPFVFASTILFVGGSTMAYKLVFPIGFSFFLDFAAGGTVDKVPLEIDITEAIDAAKVEKQGNGDNKVEKQPPKLANKPESDDRVPDGGLVADAGVSDGGIADKEEPRDTEIARGPPEPRESGKAEPVEEKAKDIEQADATEDAEAVTESDEEDKAWWEYLFAKLFREDCGLLTAEVHPGSALLNYKWHTRRCGEVPQLDGLERQGAEVEAEWVEDVREDEEFTFFIFEDKPLEKGHYVYELKIVTAQKSAAKLAPMLMVKDYLSIAIRLLLAFGIIFELPILILFLALVGIVNYRQLLRFSRWFIVLSIVLAAMLTPPDVITQIMLATPLVLLYFLSVLIAYIFGRKREKEEE